MPHVQVVENWSDVEGTVEDLAPFTPNPSIYVVKIRVKAVAAVPTFPNFIVRKQGSEIAVRITKDAVDHSRIRVGDLIRLRLQQTGLNSFLVILNASSA
jgi:hypothetical protein